MNMKEKFKKLFLDITEREYREIDALSYSMLSSFVKEGPASLIKKKKDTSYFKFGRLTETLLFDEDNFTNDFHMLLTDLPTASLLELANAYFKTYDSDMSNHINRALDVIKSIGIWSKIKNIDKLIVRFDTPIFWNYLNSLYEESVGKTIIDSNDFAKSMEKVTAIRTNKYTKEFFSEKHMDNMLFQLKGIANLNGIPIKVMLDIVDIDFENMVIYPYDFKTGKDRAEDFDKNFYAYKYYMQGGLYSKILSEIIKDSEFKDFTIAPFTFIYINSGAENAPIFKVMEEGWVELSFTGWTNSFGYKSIGIKEAIDSCVWHKLNEEYQYLQQTVENKGISIIKKPI